MASRKKFLILSSIIYWFSLVSGQNGDQSKGPIYSLVPNGWELVEKGWPLEDIEDSFSGRRTQYYYVKENNAITWKLKDTFKQEVKENSGYFKLGFKLWYSKKSEDSSYVIVQHDDKKHNVLKNYIDQNYTNEWMLCEFILKYESLETFQLKLLREDTKTKIAIKDIKIEYELKSQQSKASIFQEAKSQNDQNNEQPILKNWNVYVNPKSQNDEKFDFMFFSRKCAKGCELSSSGIKLPWSKNKNITSVIVQFEYWMDGTNDITIKTPKNKSSGTYKSWVNMSESVEPTDFDKFSIKINTNDAKSNEFIAIRGLTMILDYTDNKNLPGSYKSVCRREKCDWSGISESSWSEYNNNLNSKNYYYPTSIDNSLTFMRNEDLSTINTCFSLRFSVTKSKATKIKVRYENLNERSSETIMTIKPKVFESDGFEESKFCIRDLIALNVRNYSISFIVEQHTMIGIANDFLLQFDVDSKPSTWNFTDDIQTFLRTMKETDDSSTKWNDEWKQLSPTSENNFDLTNDSHVLFKATAESQIPATALLLNKKWIKNTKELRLNESSYSVKVKSGTFKNFIIRPKICDWLSKCYDVDQELLKDSQNFRSFKFNFMDLSYSTFIKLLFSIEYFKSLDDRKAASIEFELKLEHFGDPCPDTKICGDLQTCTSDPTQDIPNTKNCICEGDCSISHCRKKLPLPARNGTNIQQSGQRYCYETLDELECINSGEEFKCICNKDSKINWNRDNKNCLEPVPFSYNWTKSDEKFLTSSYENLLEYEFFDIEISKYDVCAKLNYRCVKAATLHVLYYGSDTKTKSTLFSISLTSQTKELKFCVRDFRFELNLNFTLGFVVDTKDDIFIIDKLVFQVEEIKQRSLTYTNESKEWKFIPESFTYHSSSIESKGVSTNEEQTALIISEWIDTHSKFNSEKNVFIVKLPIDQLENHTLKQRILTWKNGFVSGDVSSPLKLTKTNYNDVYLCHIENLTSLTDPFKVIIELSYRVKKEEKLNDNSISFKQFSIGDPCFDIDSELKTKSKCDIPNSCNKLDFNGVNQGEKFCENVPSLPNEKVCEMRPEGETMGMSCKCPGDSKWDKVLNRCLKKVLSWKHKSCVSNSCDFIDTLGVNMHWSNKNNRPLLTDFSNELEIYRPKNNFSQLKIEISNLENKHELCIEFCYSLSENTHLDIEVKNLKLITLGATYKTKINDFLSINLFEKENFCVNKFNSELSGNFSLIFNPIFDNLSDYTMAIIFKTNNKSFNVSDTKNYSPHLPYLTHWSENNSDKSNDGNFSFDNQWPVRFPDSFWKSDPNDAITFTVQDNLPTMREAYLISNWLDKESSNRELRFNISNSNFTDFLLKIFVINDKMQQIQIKNAVIGDDTMDANACYNETIKCLIPSMEAHFKIAIKVEYRTKLQFQINSLDLGDSCIDEYLHYGRCKHDGKCIRNSNDYYCNCTGTQYIGKNCENYDSCNNTAIEVSKAVGNTTGTQFCKDNDRNGIDCANDDNDLGFKCICLVGKYWKVDLNTVANSKCSNYPKCLLHKCDKTEICIEPDGVDEQPRCECDHGNNFVNISNKCVKLDPCNKDARSIFLNTTEAKPCGDPKAECMKLGEGVQDYICVCPSGFRNVDETLEFREKTRCESIFCSFPSLNNCEQDCNSTAENGKNYTCECSQFYQKKDNKCLKSDKICSCKNGTYCLDDGRCGCRKGYKGISDENGNVTGCTPLLSYEEGKAICPNGKLKNNNGELACDCETPYELNEKNTCDFKPICGGTANDTNVCRAKHALCVTDITEMKYRCQCAQDKAPNSTNDSDWICIDKCLLHDRVIECSSMNAICDPLKIIDDNVTKDKYCVCKPGFVKYGNQTCKLATHTQQFTISLKNDYLYNLKNGEDILKSDEDKHSIGKFKKPPLVDIRKLVNDLASIDEENLKLKKQATQALLNRKIENVLTSQIISIIKLIPKYENISGDIILDKWNLNSDNFFECTFTIPLKDPLSKYGNLTNDLKQKCQPFPKSPDLCFIEVTSQTGKYYYSGTPGADLILINRAKLVNNLLINYEPCDKSRIPGSCPGYSNCRPKIGTSLYDCLCDQDYFSVGSEEKIDSVDENQKHVKQSCIIRDDLCNKCPSQNGMCYTTVTKTTDSGDWRADPHCTCHDSFILSNNSKECIGVCYKRDCNHGSCKPKGASGFACECSEGWSGENCDIEYKASLGGWIAGIVVLAVLVVIAGGVALIFARRARNIDYGGNHSAHQMDEFARSSYRVEQSRPARGQPTYQGQGRDNQAFHRD